MTSLIYSLKQGSCDRNMYVGRNIGADIPFPECQRLFKVCSSISTHLAN